MSQREVQIFLHFQKRQPFGDDSVISKEAIYRSQIFGLRVPQVLIHADINCKLGEDLSQRSMSLMLHDSDNGLLLPLGHIRINGLPRPYHELLELHLLELPGLLIHDDNCLSNHILNNMVLVHVLLVAIKELRFILFIQSLGIVDLHELSTLANQFEQP